MSINCHVQGSIPNNLNFLIKEQYRQETIRDRDLIWSKYIQQVFLISLRKSFTSKWT